MQTKKNILIISSIGIILYAISVYPVDFGICSTKGTQCTHLADEIQTIVEFFPVIFFFSFITYFMREEVFRAWWNFARWWIPIIIIGTILCNMMPSNRGFFNMDGLIYLMVLAPLYSILILGSLWKIIRTHLRLKQAGN